MEPKSLILPDVSKPVSEQDPIVLFAMCLFGETRGESDAAQRAVAQVVLNRANHPRALFGSRKDATFLDNLRSVILQPQQFSSLNPFDSNYGELLCPLSHEAPATWERCLNCAASAINQKDRPDTTTLNSDHYFDDSIQPPQWAQPAKQTVKIGRLNFYRLYLPASAASSAARPSEKVASAPEQANSVLSAKPVKEPKERASDFPTGPRLRANVSPCARPRAVIVGGDTLAPGLQNPRPNAGFPAPQSSIAHSTGPRTYLRYDWSRGLSLLALLGISLMVLACSDFEQTAYRVLAVTQAEYETTQQHVAEAAAHGLVTDDQWNQFEVEGHRFIAAHNSAVDAFQLWSQTKSQSDTARVQALLDILPQLVAEINKLVGSFGAAAAPPSAIAPAGDPAPSTSI